MLESVSKRFCGVFRASSVLSSSPTQGGLHYFLFLKINDDFITFSFYMKVKASLQLYKYEKMIRPTGKMIKYLMINSL